jgi:alpha-methylacyl-CoA racemase
MSGPLAGVRVIELAGIGPVQHAGMLLADLGADVIRVDRVAASAGHDQATDILSRGRRSVVLDLKDSADRRTLEALLEHADLLLDPYRPGVLERLGLDPDDLTARHPRLIVARMTGWGQTGPLAHAAGHDINYIALAGALGTIGPQDGPPAVPLNLVGDYGGGSMLLAFGVVAALYERERSGLGQVLDVAMVDGVASLMAAMFQLQASGAWRDGRERNWVQGAAPWYRAYATADGGHVTVGALEGKFYALLLEQLGLDAGDWPQWDRTRWPALATELARIFASRTRAEWIARLEGSDACFAAVLELNEVLDHEHLRARGTFVERDDVVQPAAAPRFSRTPAAVAPRAPWAGQHQAEVLAELASVQRR